MKYYSKLIVVIIDGFFLSYFQLAKEEKELISCYRFII